MGGFVIGHTVLTVLAYLGRLFICGGAEANTSGNPFSIISDFILFQGCEGLPSWFGFIIFMSISFIWMLIVLSALMPVVSAVFGGLAGGTFTGPVLAGVAIAIFAGIITTILGLLLFN